MPLGQEQLLMRIALLLGVLALLKLFISLQD